MGMYVLGPDRLNAYVAINKGEDKRPPPPPSRDAATTSLSSLPTVDVSLNGGAAAPLFEWHDVIGAKRRRTNPIAITPTG
jgi:hypothetical protein